MAAENQNVVNVLTVAGLDPSGGAGILADVKTMSALGGYGMAIAVALTAQNTCKVSAVEAVAPDFIRAQFEAIFSDIRVDAVKIGMLLDATTVHVVAECLQRWHCPWVVLDPVMVAKSGDALLLPDAVHALKTELLPLANVVTPNLPECSVLIGHEVSKEEDMAQAALELYYASRSRAAVYLKGGHLASEQCDDYFYDGQSLSLLSGTRVKTKNTHGTGCTLSAAIATLLAQTGNPTEAVFAAKRYMKEAIAGADRLQVGSGHGPVDHFFAQRT